MSSKCSILVMLLISLISSTSAAINSFSLRDLHSHVASMPDQLDTAHLEYQLNSGSMTPLQVFERLYNVKLDKESIGKVGGAKCEVLELLRKWKESESSDKERDEVIAGIEEMEKLKNEGYGSEMMNKWEEVSDAWLQKLAKLLNVKIEKRFMHLFRVWNFRKSKIPLAEIKELTGSERVTIQVNLRNFLIELIYDFPKFQTVFNDKIRELTSILVDKAYDELSGRLVVAEQASIKLPELIPKLEGLKADCEKLELIQTNGAPDEIRQVIESAEKFQKDYANYEFNWKFDNQMPSVPSVKELASKLTNINHKIRSSSQSAGEWTQVTDVFTSLGSFDWKWEQFENVNNCIKHIKGPVDFTSQKESLDKINGFIKVTRNNFQSAFDWVKRFGVAISKVKDIEPFFKKMIASRDTYLDDTTEHELIDFMRNTVWKLDTDEINTVIGDMNHDLGLLFNKTVRDVLKSEFDSVDPASLLADIKKHVESDLIETITCFERISSTVPSMKQSISEMKSLNSLGDVNVLGSAVHTWDSLNEAKTLIDEFEVQKLVDPAEIKITEDPTDKINRLKNGIPALKSLIEVHRIGQNMKRDFDVLEKFQGFETVKPMILEFLATFEDVEDSEDSKGYSEVISSIGSVTGIPKLNFSQEFITFATENTVVEVEKLMDFEKNFADYQLKIKEMGGVLEEVNGWVEKEQKATVAPVKTVSRYGDECDCDQVFENSTVCGTTCEFDWDSIGF